AITQGRSRLGWQPLHALYEVVVRPIATRSSVGAWYRKWRLVTLDGSTLDVADTKRNERAFGRPGSARGKSGFPQLRFVTLLENGTHVLFGAELGRYDTGEVTLAKKVVTRLPADALCLADRNFFSYSLWNEALKSGAALRITFGTVKGYVPRDGVAYVPQTTVAGVVQKNTASGEFDAPKAEL